MFGVFSKKPQSAESTPLLPVPGKESTAVTVKEPYTLLSTLLKDKNVKFPISPYDGKTVTFGSPNYRLSQEDAKQVFGQYEAALTQAAYFSRIIYEPNVVAASAAQFVHYNPVVFNTALSLVRGNYSRLSSNDSPIVNVKQQVHNQNKDGLFLNGRGTMDDTPCYLQYLDYTGNTSNVPYPNKKVLYIVFRGTLTVGGALADVNAVSVALNDLLKVCSMGGMTGSEAFRNEIKESEISARGTLGKIGINPFGAHRGFVHQMINVMGAICEALEKKFLKLPIDHIVVTGHSLGAANATLASLVLGGFKKEGKITPPIHCITFGGPKLLTDYSRNVYNSLLTGGFMTLDRIANRASAAKQAFSALSGVGLLGASVDWVPLIPPNFNHPGFMPGKLQFKTQSKMGMSNNISDLRQMFTGISPPSSLSFTGGTFNGIPLYPEFLAYFMQLSITKKNATTYDINTVYATIIGKTGTLGIFAKNLYTDEYNAIKKVVETVLGQSVSDVATDPAKEPLPSDITPPPTAVAAIKEVEEPPNSMKGGDHTSNYKALRDTLGSNQITYSPQMVVCPVSAHLNYMGVGWNGALKNVQHIRHACQEIQYGNIAITPYCVSHTELTGRNTKGGQRIKQSKRAKRSKQSKRATRRRC
jgi:hypothetical protein